MKLGEIIKQHRTRHKLSMGDFAKLAGISKPYVSMLEANRNSRSGKPIAPSVSTLGKVAKVLHISVGDLLLMMGDEVIDVSGDNAVDAVDEQEKLLGEFQKLNLENQKLVMNMMKQLNVGGKRRKTTQNVIGNSNVVAGGNIHLNQQKE